MGRACRASTRSFCRVGKAQRSQQASFLRRNDEHQKAAGEIFRAGLNGMILVCSSRVGKAKPTQKIALSVATAKMALF